MKAHPIASFALALLLALAAPLKAAPIHDAAKKGDVAEIRRLLDEGGDVNAENDDGSTPLSVAIRYANGYDIASIKLLLERGADVNGRDKEGGTALWYCVANSREGQREIFDLLIQKGAIVDNRKNSAGYSLADFAVSGGNFGILKDLIAKGAKLDIQDPKVMCQAAMFGSKEMLEYLLDAGGNPNAQSKDGQSALICCFGYGGKGKDCVEKAKLLVERGADVNGRDKEGGETVLMKALPYGPDIVKLLLDKGADVNAKDSEGKSVLHRAIRISTESTPGVGVRVVEIILDHGADINVKNNLGICCLGMALAYRPEGDVDARFIKMLLEHGADIGGQFSEHLSLITVGKNSKDPEIRKVVEAAEKELHQRLDYCLKDESYDADMLIASKNVFLPKFLSTATNEQKVDMLTAVEKRIVKTKVHMGEFNEQGRAALRKGKDASASRKEALQIGAYLDVLKEIKAILEGS